MAHEEAKTGQAKSLRKRMTAAERRLWSRLAARRSLGLHWLRQEPFGRFIVDFYCPTARLIVELDGAAHIFTTLKDQAREEWLRDQGATVLRFPNIAVMNDLSRVLAEIEGFCRAHVSLDRNDSDD